MGISMVADILEDGGGAAALSPTRTERSLNRSSDGPEPMHVSRATLNRNLKHHPRQFHDKQAAELKRQLVQKQQKQQTITVARTASGPAEPAAAAQSDGQTSARTSTRILNDDYPRFSRRRELTKRT